MEDGSGPLVKFAPQMFFIGQAAQSHPCFILVSFNMACAIFCFAIFLLMLVAIVIVTNTFVKGETRMLINVGLTRVGSMWHFSQVLVIESHNVIP